MRGDHRPHQRFGRLVGIVAFDQDFVDVPIVNVTERPLDDVTLLIDEGGCS